MSGIDLRGTGDNENRKDMRDCLGVSPRRPD